MDLIKSARKEREPNRFAEMSIISQVRYVFLELKSLLLISFRLESRPRVSGSRFPVGNNAI